MAASFAHHVGCQHGDLHAPVERPAPSKTLAVTRGKPFRSSDVAMANILNSLETFLVRRQSGHNTLWIPLVGNVGRILNSYRKLHALRALRSEDESTMREVLASVQEQIDLLCQEGELEEFVEQEEAGQEVSELDRSIVTKCEFIQWLADSMLMRVQRTEGTLTSVDLESVVDCCSDAKSKYPERLDLSSLLDLDCSQRSIGSTSTADMSHSSTSSLCGDRELTPTVFDDVREEGDPWTAGHNSELTPAWELEFLLRSDIDR